MQSLVCFRQVTLLITFIHSSCSFSQVAAADRIAHGSDIVRALPPSSTTNLTGRSLPPSSRSNAAGTSELAITEVAPAAAGQVPMHAAVGDELEAREEFVFYCTV